MYSFELSTLTGQVKWQHCCQGMVALFSKTGYNEFGSCMQWRLCCQEGRNGPSYRRT
jgi:hypothetical protein